MAISKNPKKDIEKSAREQRLEYIRNERAARLNELQTKAREVSKKAFDDARYIYKVGGHIKNEALGYLTVFNFDRSFDVDIEAHIKYTPDDNSLYLNVYQPKNRSINQKLPVFVYIHGGGWIGGWPETREAFTTRIAAAGYFVISIFYGHAPEYAHPQPTQNVFKALGWLRDNAAKYNIDVEEIFIGGESAGAHLAAMAGAITTNPEYGALYNLDERSRNQKIRGLVLNCGVYDIEKAYGSTFHNIEFYIDCYCGMPYTQVPKENRKEVSPINYLTMDFPPTIAISAQNDKLAPCTFDFVNKLDELGTDVRHFHATGAFAVHAFAVAPVFDVARDAMSEVGIFLEEKQRAAGKDYPIPSAELFSPKKQLIVWK